MRSETAPKCRVCRQMCGVSVSDVVDVVKEYIFKNRRYQYSFPSMSTRISRHLSFPPTETCNMFNKIFVSRALNSKQKINK
ncbi:hypothetical protein E2542_SST21809 [Spatholobus suberectus]|nr:hypothetical protein E2542_SST21806 [Spatholobus suberectus]TKY57361.1 hypothetical protein E2542_SST21809 [Spatholobus suberectus]